MNKTHIQFYCAETNKNGYTCEAQCDKCRKAERFESPKPVPAHIIKLREYLREDFDKRNLEDSQNLIDEIKSWNLPEFFADQIFWMETDLQISKDNKEAVPRGDFGC